MSRRSDVPTMPQQSTENDSVQFRTIPNDYSRYSRLKSANKEIRLLRVLPRRIDGLLTVSICKTSLLDHPPYRCLSYTWGDLGDTTTINMIFNDGTTIGGESAIVNDIPEVSRCDLEITRNLHQALLSLQRDNAMQHFWIDMLCINQGDINERSEQVSMMKEVFAASTEVHIWMELNDASAEAWLADENAELAIFRAALMDHGYGVKRQYFNVYRETTLKDIYLRYADDVELLLQSGAIEGEHELEGEMLLFRNSSGHVYPCESVFSARLRQYLPAVERLAMIDSYKVLPVPNRRTGFLYWLFAIYIESKEASFHKAFRIYLSRVTHPTSEVMKFLSVSKARPPATDSKHALTRRLELVYQPWFTRVWVLQEIISNPNAYVRARGRLVPFEIFGVLLQFAGDHWQRIRFSGAEAHLPDRTDIHARFARPWRTSTAYLQNHAASRLGLPLLELLDGSARMGATDPRDRIFALQHLATDVVLRDFRPAYSKSVLETYIDFTKSVIRETGSVKILHARPHSQRLHNGLVDVPSWLPDYQNTLYVQSFGANASKQSKTVVRSLPDSRVLSLQGFHAATVCLLWDVPEFIIDSKAHGGQLLCKMWSFLRQSSLELKDFHHLEASRYLKDHTDTSITIESFADTILASSNALQMLTAVWRNIDNDLRFLYHDLPAWCTLRLQGKMLTARDQRDLLLKSSWTIAARVGLIGTCFVRTSTGGFGLCPAGTRAGDMIVTIYGSDFPVVLRQIQRKGKSRTDKLRQAPVYELLGRCEISDAMRGEAMDRPDFGDVLYAEPTDPVHVKDGYSHCARGQYGMRFWDLI